MESSGEYGFRVESSAPASAMVCAKEAEGQASAIPSGCRGGPLRAYNKVFLTGNKKTGGHPEMRLSDLSENSRIRCFIFGQNLEKKTPILYRE